MAETLQDHDQYFDYTCNYICDSKNKVNESTKFCTECIRHMCSSCHDIHQAVHKTHHMVDPRASSQYRRNNIITEHCWKHPGKVSDLFCSRHDAVVCSACIPEHTSCGPVSYIPEVVNDMFQFHEVQQTSNQLAELGREMEFLTIGGKDAKKGEGDSESIISDIQGYSAELIGMIKTLEHTAIKEVKTTDKAKKKGMQEADEKCRKSRSELNSCLSNLLSAVDNIPQQFVCMKNGKRLVASAEQLIKKAHKTKAENQTCWFTIDLKIREAVTGFLSLIAVKGQLSQTVPLHYIQPRTKQAKQPEKQDTKQPLKHDPETLAHKLKPNISRSTPIVKAKTKLLRISTVKKYNVVCKNDHIHVPSILGCCLLSNSCVILSDNSNKGLKLFDPSTNTVTKTLIMPTRPLGVCCVSTQEVAVALDNKSIQFVFSIPSLTLSRSLKMDHDCWGIAYTDDCLFITDKGKKVYIHNNRDGSLVQVITVPGVFPTQDIAVSPRGGFIYVTDNTRISCMERFGRPVYTGGARGVWCSGVSVDESGCVVVCDDWRNKVVQVGEGGEVLAELLGSSDEVRKPRSVCMDSSNMKLYVTQHSNEELIVASFLNQTND